MSDAVETTEAAETEAVETETPVKEVEPVFELPEFDWEAVIADENAPAAPKLIAPIMLLANKANELRTKYLSMTDIDSAVEQYAETSEDKDIVQWRKELAQAEKLIAKNNALIAEKAKKEVSAKLDPNFDEQVARAAYNDTTSAIKTAYNEGTRNIFKMLGHLTSDVSPTGRETNWRATSGFGQLLLNAYRLPKLDKDDSTAVSGKTDPTVTAWNKAAKEWGKANGFTVKDKGALALDLKEAYAKSLEA
jgi:hypothetical protein